MVNIEKLLKHKNIKLYSIINEDETIDYYAYTDKLLYNNILVHFYSDVLNNSEEYYEAETAVSVLAYNEENSYTFMLFVAPEVIHPLLLYRIIVDAMEYILNLDDSEILENIEEISTGCLVHHKNEKYDFYNNKVSKIMQIIELINKKN